MTKILLLLIFFSTKVFAVAPAIDCSGPMAPTTPEDYELASKWCTDQAKINYYWNVYKLGQGDWSKWGFKNMCDPSYGLVRFINALYKMEQLSGQNYAYKDGANLWINGHARINDWAGFTRSKDVQGFRPKCADSTSLLGHQNSTYIPIDITQNALYYRNTDILAAVAIHELTHNDVDHISDSSCMNGASCDTAPGNYNASTTEVYYLIDVMNASKRSTDGNKMLSLAKLGDYDSQYNCSYVGVSSLTERSLDYSFAVAKLNTVFQNTVNSGTSSDFLINNVMIPGQAIFNNSFACEFCNPNTYDMSPASKWIVGNDPNKVVTQTHIWPNTCNLAHNADNFENNLRNKMECTIIKSHLDDYIDGNNPLDIKFLTDLSNKAQALSKNCPVDNETDIKSYCDGIITAADSDINNIDKYGIYASHGHKFWQSAAGAASACCKRLNDKNMTAKMAIIGCNATNDYICNMQSGGDARQFAACKACVYSDDPLKCFYDNGKQIPVGCYKYDTCFTEIGDKDYCTSVAYNCM